MKRRVLCRHFPHGTFPMGSWLSIALCDCPETGAQPLLLPHFLFLAGVNSE